MPRATYRIIDLFSGAGGFSIGFHSTGRFKTILAIDNFKYAVLTFKANIPQALVLASDIREIGRQELADFVRFDEIDVVIGSPPCEPFTGANPNRERNPIDRLYVDPQGQLTLHYIRIVGLIKPRIFVMENVPAIMEDGLRDALLAEFKRIGYPRVYFNILRAENYGTPSHRTRVFISNVPIKPSPRVKPKTVGEVLRDLPPPGDPLVLNHDPPPELSWRKTRKIHRLRAGRAVVYYQGAKGLLPNLIKLDPDKIAPTVLGSSRFIHPFEPRLLTVREQARLMGFPDSFVFIGGRDSQYNMIGEAVPPPLARSIGEAVAKALDEGDVS